MNTRKLTKLDYGILHESGKKVLKFGVKMATSDEIVTESKIREDIYHTLRIYVLAELTSENEILEGLEIINDLCQQFRHSHVELKKSLTNYSDVYQNDYAAIYEKLVTFIKDAKK